MPYRKIVNRHPAFVAIALFLNFVVLISLAGHFLVDNFKEREKKSAFENLRSIGNLKAGQIEQYLQTRKGDAVIVAGLLSNSAVRNWLKNPVGEPPNSLHQSLDIIRAIYQLGGLQVLDDKANLIYSDGQYTGLSQTGKSLALQAAHENSLGLSPIYFGDPSAPDRPLDRKSVV